MGVTGLGRSGRLDSTEIASQKSRNIDHVM